MEGGDWEGLRVVNFKRFNGEQSYWRSARNQRIHSMLLFIYRHYSLLEYSSYLHTVNSNHCNITFIHFYYKTRQ